MTVTYKTQTDKGLSSRYMSIAIINTTNKVLTEHVANFLEDYLKKKYAETSYEITREHDLQLGVLIHDAPEKLDELVADSIFKEFQKHIKNLPSGTMGNIEYATLTGYVKSPFKRTLPSVKKHMMHIYKK